ncbi:gliding motility-associated C-terminal domain-containing protein, partial [Tamlana sp. 2201CG12-4]|uniref:gliding motility-associated C-terminal domain-containing protein n=1 Tax=Tamlana sp. 2201CG12-4 TaxID=3112582 RepID=UPI002DB9D79E
SLSNDSASVSIPQLCDGGTATVTWTITDLCETINTITADFNLTAPAAVTYNNPADEDVESCDFVDQDAVDTAFTNWVNAQSTAIAQAGGCTPSLSNDSASVSIPQLCDGGTATVTWTITDLCETINTITADFNLTAPAAVTYNNPADEDVESCDFVDQDAVDTAFTNWVNAQSTAIAQAGGCTPSLSNDSASVSIPQLCDGGTATVTWTITDLCETINTITADFNLTAPAAVTYNNPADSSTVAADFDDPDATIAQANLDADIAAWVTAQTEAINNSITGGCAPQVTHDFVDQSITFCNSGSITITWTVQDLCGTTTPTATYSFTQPDGINFNAPSGKVSNSCDFNDNDISIAQANLDADIATWVTAQTNIINNSLTGGSPSVSHDFTNQSIDLCAGGSLTITWTIDDICETINESATYTLTAPAAITYNNPADEDVESCDFVDQDAVDTAFTNWVNAQSTAIAQAGGCTPSLSNDSASVSIPQLCDGGTATVTWTITDLCETINTITADFNLTAPAAVTYNNPADEDVESCDFDNTDATLAQTELNTDIATWVTTQTTAINNSIAGGCSPVVTNDFVAQSIDFCTGGSITITWSIQNLCETINLTATYTFTQPTPAVFDQTTLPTNIDVECDSVPDAEILTASNTCGNINVVFTEDRTDGNCINSYSLLRTWTAINICGVSTVHTQTITVSDNTPPVLTLPANVTAECSDDLSPIAFGSATATDNCDPNPVITFVDVRTDGACSGTYTITRTWTATDVCGNSASANQIISTSDTTAPEFVQTTLPADVIVECDAIPAAEILTATDNCGSATVTVADVRTDGNCPSNYVITRTYTATDECGLTNTHVQTITVQDTIAPEFVETLPPANLVVECDAVPVAETLTATDICGTATVSVSDARTDGNCPNTYTLTRTWVATDECGLTTSHIQIITVQDTKAPEFVETLPRDITVECDAVPDPLTITATDNCGDAVVTVNDVRTDGDCPSSYIIVRTYTATDACNLTTTHTQIITVQDTTAPVPTTTFEETIDVSCIDIPDAPVLDFTDNCTAQSNIIVVYNETSTYDESTFADYQITRTWTVRDECDNEEVYTQTLNVALDEIFTEINAEDRCYDEGVIDLNSFLSDDVSGGFWEIIEGNTVATINGNIFDPTHLDEVFDEDFNPRTEGIQYLLRYTGFESGCMNVTEVTMIIDAKCVVLPCGENDLTISKAVTPNGDGFNETFDIAGIDLCGFVAEVKIFNRWGALVYESNNYTLGSIETSGAKGDWDGSSPKSSIGNAGKLPNGTYYYIINLKNSGLSPLTGPVYIGTK